MPAIARGAEFTAFLPFTKISEEPDGTLLVHTVVNDESVDDQGEVMDYVGTKAALDDFMVWANVREMHQLSAVGTAVSMTHDDLAKTSEAVLRVVDPAAVQKVLEGVYKGTSVGGKKGPAKLEKVGGMTVRRLVAPFINEISLVDRPSRPTAALTLMKLSQAEGEEGSVSDELETGAEGASTTETAAEGDQPALEVETDAGTESVAAAETAETPEAAAETTPEVLEQASQTGDLAKSAADDVVSAHYIIESINRLIEEEAGEGDQVASLKAALASMQAFEAAENDEVGTPEDVAAEEAEKPIPVVIVEPMYYAAVIGDLAKAAISRADAIAKGGEYSPGPFVNDLIKAAIAAGGEIPDADTTPAATEPLSEETLAKVTGAAFEHASTSIIDKVTQAIGAIARPEDLAAVKVELLGALKPLEEQLTKIASQPMPGGPLRYATDARRFDPGEAQLGPQAEAEVLQKAAGAASDPVVKEALGKLAAEAQLRTTLANPSQIGR